MGAPLNTQSAGGIDALRDHDRASPLETRSVRWAVTHGGYDQYGNRRTSQKGDINCATWWPAGRRTAHGWAFAWPVVTGGNDAFAGFTYGAYGGPRGGNLGGVLAAPAGAGGGAAGGGGSGGGAGAINAATGVGSNSGGNIGGWAGVGDVGSFIGVGPGGSEIVGRGSFFGGAGTLPGADHVGIGAGGSEIVRLGEGGFDYEAKRKKKAAGAGGDAGPEGSPGQYGQPGGAVTTPRAAENRSGDAAHRVDVTPILTAGYAKDTEFTTQSMVGRYGWPKIPEGTVGVVIAGTYAQSQLPVFIHGDPRLLAINEGEDPAMGSSVCDPYGFSARMQSAWRVVAPLTTKMPAGALNALAWQLCRTKRERNAGYGLFVDEPDKQSRGSKPTTHTEGSFSSAVFARERPAAGAGGSVPTGLRSPSDVHGSDGGDGEADIVVACASARVGGPLDVGHGTADKHHLGMSGTRHVNAGHLRYETLFYWDKDFDAPLEFQKRYYPKVNTYPTASRVHLVYDPNESHQYGDFRAVGKWRWYAEVPYADTPKEKPPPRRPPPTTGPPPTTDEPPRYPYDPPGLLSPPPPPTTTPTSAPTSKRPNGRPGGGGSDGPGGSGDGPGAIGPWAPGAATYQTFVSWPGMVGFNGQLFRPAQMTAGLPDLRGVASLPADYVAWAEETRPVVVRMEPFGAETASGQWSTQSGAQRYPFGTGQGGLLFMPPQVDLFDTERTAGFLPSTTAPYIAVWGAWWGAGTPSRTTGLLKSGFRWGMSGSSFVLQALDASSVATTGFGVTSAGAPQLRESGGPTLLTLGAVADGQYLKRSGATIIGGTPTPTGWFSAIVAKTANYTVLEADSGTMFDCDSTAGAFAMTLPTAPADKTWVGIMRRAGLPAANTVTIQAGGADVIRGPRSTAATSFALQLYEAVILVYYATPGVWMAAAHSSTADAGTSIASLRTLGTGANQACAGSDSRLSDTRTPTDNTVSTVKIVDDAVTFAKLADDVTAAILFGI